MGNDITQGMCTSTSRRVRLIAGLVATVLVVAAASCSGEDKKSSATTANPAAGAAAAAPTTAAAATTAAMADTTAATTAATAAGDGAVSLSGTPDTAPAVTPTGSPVALAADATPFGSALAITASVTVEVPDVRKAVIDLPDLVTAQGGAIFDS